MKCIFFPERRLHPSLNRILLYREEKKKKHNPAALHNLSQKPYSFSPRTWKGPTAHEWSRTLLSPGGSQVIFIQADRVCTVSPHVLHLNRLMCNTPGSAPLSARLRRAEASKPCTELSVCEASLFFRNLATPLLPCHRSAGKGAFSLFQAPKTVLHQKARVSVRLRSGSDFEHEWAFSIRPERETEEGGWGRTQGPRVLFKCLPFACLWGILKQQGDGGRRNYGMRTRRPF